jgi:hypothetical protein
LLHHAGCRSVPAVQELVLDCLRSLAIPALVDLRVGDYPSLTLLIDGTDVMGPAPLTSGTACRLDIPTRERVLAALTAQLATATRTTPSTSTRHRPPRHRAEPEQRQPRPGEG